jgi:ribosomal-protein-alanine N-acetyltransferase
MQPSLKTARLLLRPPNANDAEGLFALRSNKEVNRHLDRKPAHTLQDARHFISIISEKINDYQAYYWVITLHDDPRIIGTILLFNFSADKTQAEIGYELLPAFQGKGLMQEAVTIIIDFAFHTLNLTALEATTVIANTRSIHLLTKFHFLLREQSNKDVVIFELKK